MKDICVHKYNIDMIIPHLLDNVNTVCNKKRHSKRAEYYLRCGGGLDTESTTVMHASRPEYAFLYHIQICINGTYMYMRDIHLVTKFFELLCNEVRKKKQGKKQPVLIIWVANLGHEYSFLKRQLGEVGISDLFAKNEREPLRICLQDVVELRECIGLFGTSLAKIAENYTATQKLKGDLDYDLIRTPDTELTESEYNYCKNDVVILDELSEVAFKMFTDKGLKIPMTSTGILRQKCKNRINNIKWEYAANEKLMPDSEHDYYLMRRYMFAGGLSGTSPIYEKHFISRSKCADITSDYPAQINQHLYPSGELIECEPKEIAQHKGCFKIIMFSCDIRPKTKHAVISKHKVMNFFGTEDCDFMSEPMNCVVVNGKILYGDNLLMLLNDVDIRALNDLYEFKNVKIYRTWYFTRKERAPHFLRACMNEDYLLKQSLKATGQSDTVMYKEAKRDVNSYFGMTCTRLYDCMYGYDDDIDDIAPKDSELNYTEQRKRMWLSPYIGYWCTSYARAILIHYIAKYPDLILQYDTDSLYYITDDKTVPDDRIREFENELQMHNKKIMLKNARIFKNNQLFYDLGAWDIDKDDYTGFKGLGAKRYLLRKKDGTLKPVVAGMVKSSFFEYIKRTGAEPFEVFKNNLTLDRVISKKLASVYYDNTEHQTILQKIRDYKGHESIIEIGTYHALYPIEFNMKVASAYEELCHCIQTEKAFPVQYREYEKYLRGE